MTVRMHHNIPKVARDKLNLAVDRADDLHQQEEGLVELLYEIDQNKFFVRFGYKSLRGFCIGGLKFSKTQSQRIVTKVRRYEPTSNVGRKKELQDLT